jgi:hypothetical protein
MVKIPMFVCLNKIGVKNVVFVSDHLQFSSGKEIKESLKEHVFVVVAAKIKTYVKFVR